jgi:hypothetical protein
MHDYKYFARNWLGIQLTILKCSFDIICFLETLPTDHHHCVELSAGAFYLALADYSERENQKVKLLLPQ